MTQSAEDSYKNVWGNKVGFGKKPALLVIDFLKGYTTEGSPLFAPGVISAVRESIDLISAARHHGIPVIHTKVRYHPQTFADGGMWVKKAPVLECLVEGNELANFCDEVLPLESETIIIKQYASAFFGTSLIATLNALDIDTVLMAGCTTSGCIRATAVDCIQYGFRPIVVEECVGDRHPDPHDANLFDIGQASMLHAISYMDFRVNFYDAKDPLHPEFDCFENRPNLEAWWKDAIQRPSVTNHYNIDFQGDDSAQFCQKNVNQVLALQQENNTL